MKTITTLLILSFLSANTLFARVHANYIGSGTSKIDTINGTSLRVNKMIRFRESKKDLLRKLGPPDSIVSRSSHYADSIFDYYYSNLVYEQEEGDSVSFSSIHLEAVLKCM